MKKWFNNFIEDFPMYLYVFWLIAQLVFWVIAVFGTIGFILYMLYMLYKG